MRHLALSAAVAALLAPGMASRSRADSPSPPAAMEMVGGGGIQWFTRLKDGLAEARRTGKPILYLSAAPSCGGVPGVW